MYIYANFKKLNVLFLSSVFSGMYLILSVRRGFILDWNLYWLVLKSSQGPAISDLPQTLCSLLLLEKAKTPSSFSAVLELVLQISQ